MPIGKKISSAYSNYQLALRVLESFITKTEEKHADDIRWFVFSEKIGRKYLTQAYTLQQLFENDIFIVKKGKEHRFVDFHSMFILLRALLETYAVFSHLFADQSSSIQERIVRFRLWEFDGLRLRQKHQPLEDSLIRQKLEKEKIDIANCITIIMQFDYFNNLDAKDQQFLIDKSAWRSVMPH